MFHRASIPQEELLSLFHYRAGGRSDASQTAFIWVVQYPAVLNKITMGFLNSPFLKNDMSQMAGINFSSRKSNYKMHAHFDVGTVTPSSIG